MDNFDKYVKEVDDFFKNRELPTTEIKVNSFTTILNLAFFVESHLDVVKAHTKRRNDWPYLQRLMWVKRKLENDERRTQDNNRSKTDDT